MITVAVDLGGTQVRAAVVDPDGRVRLRLRRETPHAALEPIVLVEMATQLLATVEPGAVRRVVVGVPGTVDYAGEQLLSAPNLPPAWAPCLSEAWLSERIGTPVALANDADLAAVGEASFGAGTHVSDLVYVTISTGIGAGTVLGGRLVHGRYSGSEIGHTVIDRSQAALGGWATVEELGSGTALARLAAEAGLTVDGPGLAALAGADETGVAARIWREALEAAALGIVNLCWVMSPQLVVVGGGVGMNAELVLPILRAALQAHGPDFLGIEVVSAVLGDDAGLAGAAAWWQAVGRRD